MPRATARGARDAGRRVLAAAIRDITDPALDMDADSVTWLTWGDLPAFLGLLQSWTEAGVSEAIMAGKVEQRRIYDDRAGALDDVLGDLGSRHTDQLIGAAVGVLEGAGIRLLESTVFLHDYLATEGPMTHREPTDEELADIEHGWSIAKKIGGLDIGQTVVVKGRAVVAVEAMEGTDECIRRAAGIAGDGSVVVKVAKPGQDLRFDVPVVGLDTVEVMVATGARVLAVEAGITVLFDREHMVRRADASGIAVVGRTDG